MLMYFSRSITRLDYLVGKFLSLLLFLLFVTLGPGLILFVGQLGMSTERLTFGQRMSDLLGVTLSDDIAELFEFPKSLEVYREERTLSIPVALVIPADRDVDFWKAYVDAASKAGHTVKTFYAESDAIEWLAEVRDAI